MKKMAAALLAGLCVLLSTSFAFAAEKGISSIRVRVELNKDGSADITEVWEIEDVYKGTEYYKALNNVGKNTVSNLTVTDDRGVRYTTLSNWDTDASFEDKANKCGINATDEGYELCWGISEMGDRTYTWSYRLEGLVKHYSDSDGFYHQFISDDMSSAPKAAEVIVSMDWVSLSAANSRIWAFGYKGEIHHANGEIAAWSSEALGKNNYVNILAGFDHGLFDAPTGKGTFAAIQDRAINHSVYVWRTVGYVVAAIAAITAIFAAWIKRWVQYIRLADGAKQLRVREKDAELRDQPVLDSIAATNMLIKLGSPFGETGLPLSAYIIQWGLSGAVTIEENDKKSALVLHRMPEGEDPEIALYNMFLSASDSGRLSLAQWQKWNEKHEREFTEWGETLESFGSRKLEEAGLAGKDLKGTLRLTPAGNEKYTEAIGYKKYLKQVAQLETDSLPPKKLWNQMLIFAAFFGLAKEIEPGFNRMNTSAHQDDFVYMNYSHYLFMTQCGRSFSASGVNASGGSASSSGGGGFSGGGGGGSR